MRKVGKANLAKAKEFHRQQNWVQELRYGEIAATKLKQLKVRRLETVIDIDEALGCKYNALSRLARHKEALECIKECYTLWAMNHLRHPGSMRAALALIQSCIHNGEWEDAEHYARHAYFMIAEMTDSFIPAEQQPWFLAEVSYYLAKTIHRLSEAGGIPLARKQKAGEEAIMLARKALELFTQLYGIESAKAAIAMSVLASAQDYFNDVDDDEVLRLNEQAIAIYRRVEGSSSMNVAAGENNLSLIYVARAKRAQAANDQDRELSNLELALPHMREAVRIYRAINHMVSADRALCKVAAVEENILRIGIAKAAAAAAAAAATTRG